MAHEPPALHALAVARASRPCVSRIVPNCETVGKSTPTRTMGGMLLRRAVNGGINHSRQRERD